MVEHLLCKQGVVGSNPTISTRYVFQFFSIMQKTAHIHHKISSQKTSFITVLQTAIEIIAVQMSLSFGMLSFGVDVLDRIIINSETVRQNVFTAIAAIGFFVTVKTIFSYYKYCNSNVPHFTRNTISSLLIGISNIIYGLDFWGIRIMSALSITISELLYLTVFFNSLFNIGLIVSKFATLIDNSYQKPHNRRY